MTKQIKSIKKGGGVLFLFKTPFLLALGLLTRLPVSQIKTIEATDSGRSALFYPLIGLIIGVILYLPTWLFPHASSFVLAAIIVTLWAIITGGLHLDGLADSADGWLGGQGNIEKTRAIMKDPLVGSAGVIATVCLLLLKFSVISSLLQNEAGIPLIVAPLIGRTVILLLFVSTRYANPQGMAQQIIENLPRNIASGIIAVCLLIGIFFSFWGIVFSLIGFWLLRRLMLKRLGGCTGDTTGASVEISEMLFLLGASLF
jgi:adenosylcobinamide-GDP ribazoletransferase